MKNMEVKKSKLLTLVLISCMIMVAGTSKTMAAQTFTVKQDGSGNYTTINAAVQATQPGDTVEVYSGVYRETVTFPRGGNGEASRITLKAANGASVTVKASNIATGWTQYSGNTYRLIKANSYFGSFNPFDTVWPAKTSISCGGVYINDNELKQKASITEVQNNVNTWYATVDGSNTTIYANFNGLNPNTNTAEIHVRKQCITANWNKGYITINGLTIMHGCAPKDVNFFRSVAIPMDGALCTRGGHHWIIENCTLKRNRGVALDFGLGGRVNEDTYGTPAVRGYHILRNNICRDNGTNGMMAYKGPYTEIYGNKFINNNTLNTGLVSEAFLKPVDEGVGIYIHNNYFYSNQSWKTKAIWMDFESQDTRVSRNVFAGTGHLMYEADFGNNFVSNNVFIGGGYNLYEASHTFFVHNLFLDITDRDFVNSTRILSGEGWDGSYRNLDLYRPDTLTSLGTYPVRYRFNKMFNNIFYTKGPTKSATEPATYDPATTFWWGNECDYNVYYNGAGKISDYTTHPYIPDEHSAVVAGNTFSTNYNEDYCQITINIDSNNKPSNLNAPQITGSYLGYNWLLAEQNPPIYQYAPDVTLDFFGNPRTGVVIGPFASLQTGSNTFTLWGTAPGGPTIVDDTDTSLITYTGNSWYYEQQTGAYNDTIHACTATNNQAEFTFTGTGIKLVSKKGPQGGIFDIYLDDTKVSTFDAYASSAQFQVVAYENMSLSQSSHTIKMVNTGTKNPSSGGTYCTLDYFEY